MKKASISIFLAALVCLALCIPAAASQTGSLKILLDGESYSLITLHRVADLNGKLTDSFAGAELPPEKLLDPREIPDNAAALKKYALANGISGTQQIAGDAGFVLFPDLSLGIYLVYCAEGDAFDPFLVFIPSTINDETVYDVEAQPKMEDPTDPSWPDQTSPTDPSDPSDPTDPSDPSDPTDPSDIPQTGNNVVPMYLLLAVGSVFVVVGLLMILRGRKESYE